MFPWVRFKCTSLSTSVVNRLQFFSGTLKKYDICRYSVLQVRSHSSCLRTFGKKSFRVPVTTKPLRKILGRCWYTNMTAIDTNIQNNVVLYKWTDTSVHRTMWLFGFFQIFAWAFLTYTFYTPELWSEWSKFETRMAYLRKYGVQLIISLTASIAAPSFLTIIYCLSIRSIKYIILNKGGKTVTFVTFHPMKQNSQFTVPVENVKVTHTGAEKRNTTLKIRGVPLYYLLDVGGEYLNKPLFAHTVGIHKDW